MNTNKKSKKHKRNAEELLGVIGTKEDEYYFGLYLLKTCYETVLKILETFCNGFFNIPDPNLNSCYLQCLKQVNIILNSQGKILKEIGSPPKLFQSLVGNIEEADQKWELGYRQTAREYYGKIENLYVKHGSRNYQLPKFIQDYFDFTNKTVAYHKNYEKTYRQLFGLNDSKKKIVQFGNLTINLEKSYLQYKKKAPIEISPTSREIVLLMCLIKNAGSIVEYLDIAKLLRPEESFDDYENKDVARDVQFVRRDLVKILKQAGIKKSELRKLIAAKTNLGYLLREI